MTKANVNFACFTIKHSGSTANTNLKSHQKMNGSDLDTRKSGHHGDRKQAWQPLQNKV